MTFKELLRDLLAFGSPIFYFLVFARALVGPYPIFVNQLILAGILVFLGAAAFGDKVDWYVVRAGVLSWLTTLFYAHDGFTLFVLVTFTGIALSAYKLHNNLNKVVLAIVAVLVIGLISVT